MGGRREATAAGALAALLILGALAYWLGARGEAPPPATPSPSALAEPVEPVASGGGASPAPATASPPPPLPGTEPAGSPAPSARPQETPGRASAESPPAEVSGYVTRGGRPVPGARVQLEVRPRAGGPALDGEVFADGAGRYLFQLPRGDWSGVRASARLLLEGTIHSGEVRGEVSDQPLNLALSEWAGVELRAPEKGRIFTLWSESRYGSWRHLGSRSIGTSGQERFRDALDGSLVGVDFQEEPASYWFGRAGAGVMRIEEIGAAELRVKVRDASGALLPSAITLQLSGHPPLQLGNGREVGGHPGYDQRAGELLGDVQALLTRGEAIWQVPPGFPARVVALAFGLKEEWRALRGAQRLTLKRGERRTIELTLEEAPLARLQLGGQLKRSLVCVHVPSGVALRQEGDSVLLSGLLPEERAWIEAFQAPQAGGGPVLAGRLELQAGQTKLLRLGAVGRVVLENITESSEDSVVVPQLEAGPWERVTYCAIADDSGEVTWESAAEDMPMWPLEWSSVGPGQLGMDLPPGRYQLFGPSEERLRTFEVRAGGVLRLDCAPFAQIPR